MMKKLTLLVSLIMLFSFPTVWATENSSSQKMLKVVPNQKASGWVEYRYSITGKNHKKTIRLALERVCLSDEPNYDKQVSMRHIDENKGTGAGFMIEPPKIMKFKQLDLWSEGESSKPITIQSIYKPKFVAYTITSADNPEEVLEKGITLGPACKFIAQEDKGKHHFKSEPMNAE